jgi:hypothetical protein
VGSGWTSLGGDEFRKLSLSAKVWIRHGRIVGPLGRADDSRRLDTPSQPARARQGLLGQGSNSALLDQVAHSISGIPAKFG